MNLQERTDRSVLNNWPKEIYGQPSMLSCRFCLSRPDYYHGHQDFKHLNECPVPELVIKYNWYELIPTWNKLHEGMLINNKGQWVNA